MDLPLYGRVILRHKMLMVAGIVVAVLLAFLSMAKHVSFHGGSIHVTYRKAELWQNSETLLLTQAGFPEGRSIFPPSRGFADPGRFTYLADLYSQLASGDAVRRLIAKSGPIDGTVQAATVLTSTGQSSPLISIFGKSSTEAKATALTERATDAFIRYVGEQQNQADIPTSQRVQISVVESADSPLLIEPRSKTLPIVVFLATLVCFLALTFILDNRRSAPTVRPVLDEAVPANPRYVATDLPERSASA